MAAPSAAPDAVPSTYGSASGLRSRPWNVTPATASAAPTSIVVRTRGRRSSMTMVSARRVHVRARRARAAGGPRMASVSPGCDRHGPEPDPEDQGAEKQRDEHAADDDAAAGAVTAARTRSGGPAPAVSVRTAMGYGVAGASDGRTASGWSALASTSRPSTSRGPGRVTTMSSTGRDRHRP